VDFPNDKSDNLVVWSFFVGLSKITKRESKVARSNLVGIGKRGKPDDFVGRNLTSFIGTIFVFPGPGYKLKNKTIPSCSKGSI
jgi:hypothetical protein